MPYDAMTVVSLLVRTPTIKHDARKDADDGSVISRLNQHSQLGCSCPDVAQKVGTDEKECTMDS